MKSGFAHEHARQFQRHAVAFETRIEPHPEHAEQFRLAVPDAQAGLAVVDVSAGGVGLRSGIFVPKNMRLTLHVKCRDLQDRGVPQVLKVRTIARRCEMVDHAPTYQIGLQFVEAMGCDEQRLIQVVGAAQREPAAAGAKG